MDAKMSSTSALLELNSFMSAMHPPSPSSYYCADITSTLAPDMLHRTTPMTPQNISSTMPFPGIEESDLTQNMEFIDFTHDLELISPLSEFLSDHLQICEMSETWGQHTASKCTTVGGTSIDEQASATSAYRIIANSDGNTERMVLKDKLQQKPATLQQSDAAAVESSESGYHEMEQEPVLANGASFCPSFDVCKTLANRYMCKHSGCDGKSYARNEHLKRHHNE